MSKDYCPKLAQVTCGLKKHHEGPCLPHETKPTEVPSLIPDADYFRAEISLVPNEGNNLALEDFRAMMLNVRDKLYEEIGTRLLIEGRIDVVVNGELLR